MMLLENCEFSVTYKVKRTHHIKFIKQSFIKHDKLIISIKSTFIATPNQCRSPNISIPTIQSFINTRIIPKGQIARFKHISTTTKPNKII